MTIGSTLNSLGMCLDKRGHYTVNTSVSVLKFDWIGIMVNGDLFEDTKADEKSKKLVFESITEKDQKEIMEAMADYQKNKPH